MRHLFERLLLLNIRDGLSLKTTQEVITARALTPNMITSTILIQVPAITSNFLKENLI